MRKVLDLGCGPIPPTLEIFLERDVEVKYIGIDGSKEVINTAKRNYENNKFNQALIPCEWKLNGKYDLVTAFTFMDWLNRPEKAATICGINQVLNKGGKFISTFPKSYRIDAVETEQFLKSLDFDVERKYWSMNFKDIDTRKQYWSVLGTKENGLDISKEFEKYKAMSYIKAGKVKNAQDFGFDIDLLLKELDDIEKTDVLKGIEKEKGLGKWERVNPHLKEDAQSNFEKNYGIEYGLFIGEVYEDARETGKTTIPRVRKIAEECGLSSRDSTVNRIIWEDLAPMHFHEDKINFESKIEKLVGVEHGTYHNQVLENLRPYLLRIIRCEGG